MITIVDHFCGAGGESTGNVQAMEDLGIRYELHAHNHWERAIETHSLNHPSAIHRQALIEHLDPLECVPGGRVALMWASPECTHHSTARGGRPCSDQSRATAVHVIKWLQELYVERLIVENVPEFTSWGPIGANGRPLSAHRGKTFMAWVNMIRSLGYRVDWRILRAADYGDPTSRKRLFVQAVRGTKKICWPEPTHSEHPEIFNHRPWVPARDVIDWSIPSESIFNRKKPLAEATIKRIEAGITKYWREWAEPFLVVLRGTSPRHLDTSARSLSKPLPAVATSPGHFALVSGFLCQSEHGGRIHDVDQPFPTITCSSRGFGLCEPLLVQYYGNGRVKPVSLPIDTVTTKDRFALLQGNTYTFDIRFRMLQPHELAAAQGFPRRYGFCGTKTETVKQIGNAVPVNLSRALATAAFR